MIAIQVQYRVLPGQESAAERVVADFVRAVKTQEPTTSYRAYRIDRSRDFVRLMVFKNEDTHQAHRKAAYTLKLVEDLYPLCEDEPAFSPLNAIA